MTKHYWRYSAAGCRLLIAPRKDGRFDLLINDEVVGSYNSAVAAADDVFTCATGNQEWDKQGTVVQPTDIHEWELAPIGLLERDRPKLKTLKPTIPELPPRARPLGKKR
jgi:hypothetical protein